MPCWRTASEVDIFLVSYWCIKNHPEMVQAPTSQARPRDKDHLRPSNLAARTLSLVEHTLSKFGGDPCPVKRGIAAVVKCYVRKAHFFRVCWTEREKPEPCVGFNTTRDNLFCFLFCGTIIVGLRACPNRIGIENRKSKWIKTERWLVPGSHMFLFVFRFRKKHDLQPIAKIKKLSDEHRKET